MFIFDIMSCEAYDRMMCECLGNEGGKKRAASLEQTCMLLQSKSAVSPDWLIAAPDPTERLRQQKNLVLSVAGTECT